MRGSGGNDEIARAADVNGNDRVPVARTCFGQKRPTADAGGIGTAGALVDRIKYATFDATHAIVRVAVSDGSFLRARSSRLRARRRQLGLVAKASFDVYYDSPRGRYGP